MWLIGATPTSLPKRTIGDVDGDQPGAAFGQKPGKHADRTADLERPPMAGANRRQCSFLFLALVIACRKIPGIVGGGIELLEIIPRKSISVSHGQKIWKKISYDALARARRFAGKTKPSGSSVITRARWDRCSAIARCYSGSTSAISSSNVVGTTPSGSALAQTTYSSIHDGLGASLAACRQIAAAALWSPCLSFADGRTRVFGLRL